MEAFFSTIPGAIILLIIGFVFLIKGADYFVEGASAVAKKLKVPSLIIGMTIVAMGTSLPECSVSVTASMAGSNALAISNAIGSNIFNLMVVLGACALIVPLEVDANVLKKDHPFSMICAVLVAVLGFIGWTLGHIDGIILLVVFALFLIYMIRSALKARAEGKAVEEEEIVDLATWKCIVFIIGGAAAIKFGGDWVVSSATTLARAFGMSETFIGLTICALGTSLPELVTSFMAAKKNELDMAIGNVVGSNIFNLLMVVGIAAAISPIEFIVANIIDIVILLVFSALVWVLCKLKGKLYRLDGALMLILYVAYIVYIAIRDGGIA